MKIFHVLSLAFVLFSRISSGLKCHECSDLSGGQSCTGLRRFSNKDCDLPISKNERTVCKSSWKGGTIYISECSVASIEEETGCCFKGGPVNNRTICTCDTDFCIDKPEPNSIINRCNKEAHVVVPNDDITINVSAVEPVEERNAGTKTALGLKCYECKTDEDRSCSRLNYAIKRDCSQPNSPGERAVCKSWWKGTTLYNSGCSVAPLKESTGCCIKNDKYICTCDTELCVADPAKQSAKYKCAEDDSRNRGLLCYNCDLGDCTDLTSVSTTYCDNPDKKDHKTVCKSEFVDGFNRITSRIKCDTVAKEKDLGCCVINRYKTECTCETDLCLDQPPDFMQLCGSGLKCYDCLGSECKKENVAISPVQYCGGPSLNNRQKALCISLWVDGEWSSSSCDIGNTHENMDCCIEEVNGVRTTRCTCDRDLCISDGSAVTKKCGNVKGLKCYHCNSAFQDCSRLTAKDATFCRPPDTGEKSVCKTTWKEGKLQSASCTYAKKDEKTECCDKSYNSNSEYSCICTSDLCLGDGSGKQAEQCDLTERFKCHSCSLNEDCSDLASLSIHDCKKPTSANERAVCETGFGSVGGQNMIGCGTAKVDEAMNCCNDFGNHIGCKCTSDLCVGDGQGGNGKSTECPFDGLKCYSCSSQESCKDLSTGFVEFCPISRGRTSICETIWNEDGELIFSGCVFKSTIEKECCDKIKKDGKITKKCKCNNKNLCLGDGSGKTLQRCKPVDPKLQNLKLKCYICSNEAECANLGFSPAVTCNNEIGSGLTGNDELKHVCESKFENGILQSVQCQSVDLVAKTDCCTADSICTCTEDRCIGNGRSGTVGQTRPCKCGICGPWDLECYICGGDGQPSCGDGYVDDDTPRKICEPGQFCYSGRDFTGKIERKCYTPSDTEPIRGRCTHDAMRTFYCICVSDHCLGDGRGKDVIVTTKAPGVTCYQCDGDCEDLDKMNKEVCYKNEVCQTVANGGTITRRGCYRFEKNNFEPDFRELGNCGRTRKGVECFCDKALCLGDGKGDTGQDDVLTYGLQCYSCNNCENGRFKTFCPRGNVCSSSISAYGRKSSSCFGSYDPPVGRCIPDEGEKGEAVGATCYCDNEDLCIGDGNGNNPKVTKGTGHGGSGTGTGGGNGTPDPNHQGLTCYNCNNCDEVDRDTPIVACPVGHCIKSTNDGFVRRYCGTHGTVGICVDGICACDDQDGCNGSRGLIASASCSVGLAIFVTYVNLN